MSGNGGLPRGDVHHNLFSTIMLGAAKGEKKTPMWKMLLYCFGILAVIALIIAAFVLLGPLLDSH
jgi:hypothetical protein